MSAEQKNAFQEWFENWSETSEDSRDRFVAACAWDAAWEARQSEIAALRFELADSNTVPRSRYDVACQQYNDIKREASEKLKQVQDNCLAEFNRLEGIIGNLRAELAKAREAEREACAGIADEWTVDGLENQDIAAAIRARGTSDLPRA